MVTGPASELMLSLDSMVRVRLEAVTTLAVEFSRSGITGLLEDGSLHGSVPAGLPAVIKTGDATDGREPAVFSIKVEPCNTTITVQAGQLQVRAGNRLRTLAAGQNFNSAADAAFSPDPQQNFNKKKAGIFIAIGATIAVLLIALTHDRQTEPQSGPPGTFANLSPR
jgi:ferric-dicitrate binding protein FerR (iron transport regulator)